MAKRDIDKWSIVYAFFQILWARINLKVYYRRIRTVNKDITRLREPLIVAPNHQNALMDALTICTQHQRQWIFLTRADVFNKPVVQYILHVFKMLPIFRIRDGRDSLKKNEEIFETAVKILHNKKSPLCMFPEGNHGDRRRLRPLVKGIFRIAFRAQEKYKDQPGVKIIPTGIDYEHYQKFGKDLMVRFGEPIEVCEYWNEFEKNPAAATNSLRERLAADMKKTMIHIETEEYYNTYMELREICRPGIMQELKLNNNKLEQRFEIDKKIIDALDKKLENNPEQIKVLDAKTEKYVQLRKKLKLREWLLRKTRYSFIGSLFSLLVAVVFSPVLLFGFINNWPVFLLPIKFVKKIKDTQFQSTAAFGMGLVLQMIYYPIMITLGFIFLPTLALKLLYIPSILLSLKAGYIIWKLFVKNIAKIRYNFNRNRNTLFKEAIDLRKEIISEVNSIMQ